MGEHTFTDMQMLKGFAEWPVILEAIDMRDCVADILEHDDGSIDVLVRSKPPEAVTIGPSRFATPTCTCGSRAQNAYCVHAVAACLAIEHAAGRIDDAELSRFAARAGIHAAIDESRRALIHNYLHDIAGGADHAFADLFIDYGAAETVHLLPLVHEIGGEPVASSFAVECAMWIFGTPGDEWCRDSDMDKAQDLVYSFLKPGRLTRDAAPALLIAVRGLIRSLRLPGPAWSERHDLIESVLRLLRDAVAVGVIDVEAVVDAVLCDGLAAFGPAPQSFGLFAPCIGPQVCRPVSRWFDNAGTLPQLDVDGRRRLRVELALGAHDGEGLLRLFDDWPEPLYGELMARTWLFELPVRAAIAERALAEGALRWGGRVPAELGPGPTRGPRWAYEKWVHEVIIDRAPVRPEWRTAWIGDVVECIVGVGETERGRDALMAFAQSDPDPMHREEFRAVWSRSGFGGHGGEEAAEIFGR